MDKKKQIHIKFDVPKIFESYIDEKKIKMVKDNLKKKIAIAEREIKKFLDGDVQVLKKRVLEERKKIEQKLDTLAQTEIKKIKEYICAQKNELAKFQSLVEKKIREKIAKHSKKPVIKATRKKVARKK